MTTARASQRQEKQLALKDQVWKGGGESTESAVRFDDDQSRRESDRLPEPSPLNRREIINAAVRHQWDLR
jgi:hypothetical protein